MPRTKLTFDPIAEARRQWEVHDWGDAAPGMAAVTSVMRVEQLLLARVQAVLGPLDLTFARYEVLALLDFSRAGALPLGKIGVRLQVHATSVTNAVDRLENQGLVRRVPHPEDGRTTLAEITPAGRRLVRKATKLLNAAVFSDLGLNAREVESLVALLAKLRRGAGDFP